MVRNILKRYGYQVLEAKNGVEALEVWAKHNASGIGDHILFLVESLCFAKSFAQYMLYLIDYCPAGADEMMCSASHALKSSSDPTISDDPFAKP